MSNHEPRWDRCEVCGKAVYPTWQDAVKSARDAVRISGKARGLKAYWSKSCRGFHVGTSSDHRYERARRGV